MSRIIGCLSGAILLVVFLQAGAEPLARTFNSGEFTGLVAKSPVTYETAMLDYDLNTPGGSTIHFTNCKQVDATKKETVVAFEYPLFQHLVINCLALSRYSASRAANQGFFPPRLTKAFIASLPATAAFVVNHDELIQRKGWTLANYAKNLRAFLSRERASAFPQEDPMQGPGQLLKIYSQALHVSILSSTEARVITDEDDDRYILMARADFDGDGIEDIMLRIDWSARGGDGTASDLVLLSKKSASNPVEVSWRALDP